MITTEDARLVALCLRVWRFHLPTARPGERDAFNWDLLLDVKGLAAARRRTP